MRRSLLLLALLFTGCSYSGPKLQLQVGFMGANVGVTIGSDVAKSVEAVMLPPVKSLSK